MALMAVTVGCQESFEDRAARETAEYNKKFCPLRVDASTTLDSIAFDKATHTKRSYFTLEGAADNKERAALNASMIRESLVSEIKNSPNELKFKEAGYSYYFVYRSASEKGATLFETTITKEDY